MLGIALVSATGFAGSILLKKSEGVWSVVGLIMVIASVIGITCLAATLGTPRRRA
jgi:fatty acid/phospholipid biosynthesis enzyme